MTNTKTVDLLRDMVVIPSFVGEENPHLETKFCDFLVTYFNNNFPEFKLTRIPFEDKRESLLYTNSEKIKILFACHTDTVPPSSDDAFKLKVKAGKAYGLGTKDMKGGTVSTILALEKHRNTPGIGVLFYGDEEVSFKGIRKVADQARKIFKESPKIIISPESRFNLGIGARGVCVLEIKLKGLRCHSARPHLGIDAIKNCYLLIEKVEKILNNKKSTLGKTTLAIVNIEGGLEQADGKIGYHVGTIPDRVKAIISIRNARVDLDGQQIIEIIKKEASKLQLGFEAKIIEDYPARTTPKKIVSEIEKIVSGMGEKLEIGDPKVTGYNDVAILARKLNTYVVNFGPTGDGNHTKDEWVSIESIEKTAKVFDLLVKEFCK